MRFVAPPYRRRNHVVYYRTTADIAGTHHAPPNRHGRVSDAHARWMREYGAPYLAARYGPEPASKPEPEKAN